MKKYLCFWTLILGVIMTLSSLEVIDTKGISYFYNNAELYKKEMQEIKTTRRRKMELCVLTPGRVFALIFG